MFHYLRSALIVLVLLHLTSNLHAQWRWLHPTPQGNHLYAVHFPDNANGWMAGAGGTLIHTANSGTSWTSQFTGHPEDIYGIHFINSTQGYIGQGENFLVTNDGGANWNVRYRFTTLNIRAMHFLNADSGWIAGNLNGSSSIQFTSDGGNTWQQKYSGFDDLYDLKILPSGHGIASGMNGLCLISSDFGQTWNVTSSNTSESLNSISMSGSVAYIAANNGTVLKSTDNGQNWTDLNNPASGSSINYYEVNFNGTQNGFVSGADGFTIYTTDGGATWNVSGQAAWFAGFASFIINNTAYLAGSYGEMLKSTNNGSVWNTLQQRSSEFNLHGADAPSSTAIYACGENGTIIMSSNGGTSWTNQPTGFFDVLRDIAFVNTSTGVAVGDFGTIYRTTNSGTNWNIVSSNTGESLYGVSKANASTLYACGTNGTVVVSVNSGASWSLQSTPLDGLGIAFTSIFFINNQTGWISTDQSEIIYTTDGGLNWNLSSIPVSGPVNSLHFINASTGWAATEYGDLLQSTDGGANWNLVYTHTSYPITKVHFSDVQNGWALGEGFILRTADGGSTWSDELCPADILLKDAVFTSTYEGIAVGSGVSSVIGRSGDFRISVPATLFCTDNNYTATITVNSGSFNPGNVFHVELSDEYGMFTFPLEVGSQAATGNTSFLITIPNGPTDGPGYRMRIRSTNPPAYSPVNSLPITLQTSPNAYIVAGGPTAFCQGDAVTLYAFTSPSWTYQWFKNNNQLNGFTADSLVVTTTGDYQVYVSEGFCSLLSPVTDVLVMNCNALPEHEALEIYSLYPNPSTSELFINKDESIKIDRVSISDISGKILKEMNYESGKPVNVSDLLPGMYFLHIQGVQPGVIRFIKR